MSDVPPNYSLLDELLAEDDILDDVVSEVTSVMKASVEALQDVASDTRLRPRKYIKREREEAQQNLYDDYFSKNPLYPPSIFRKRFRMSRTLFLRIVEKLGKWSGYFTTQTDCTILLMEYTRNGLFLLSQYPCLSMRRIKNLLIIKKVKERILNEHLVSYDADGVF
jgi:hypothetical protein